MLASSCCSFQISHILDVTLGPVSKEVDDGAHCLELFGQGFRVGGDFMKVSLAEF